MNTYYLSGKMSGEPNYNFDLFNEVAADLRKTGAKVINPAENFDGNQDLPRVTYMSLAIRQALDSDVIVLLPGWEDSPGARLEATVAKEAGKQLGLVYWDENRSVWSARTIKEWEVGTYLDQEKPAAKAPEHEGIEQAARRLVRGDRNADYGPPTTDFSRTGRVWAALLGLEQPITPEMVALMMMGLKLSRLAQTPDHRDSRVDVIGYALTLDWVLEDRGSA